MITTQLFMGFEISEEYESQLKQLPSERVDFFIKDDPDYLQRYALEGVVYLGKFIGESLNIQSVEISRDHILSILKLLVPDFVYDSRSLIITTVVQDESRV
jgi:hypothetical protein